MWLSFEDSLDVLDERLAKGEARRSKRITRAWHEMSLQWQLKMAGFKYHIIC